jgi:hypothetical protein
MPDLTNWQQWTPAEWLAADPNAAPEHYNAAAWRRRVAHEQRLARGEVRGARVTPSPGPRITVADVPLGVQAQIAAESTLRKRAREEAERAENRRIAAEIEAEVDEIERQKAAAAADAALRARGGISHVVTPPKPELRYSSVKLGDEPLTYGPHSSWSYVRDMFLARTHGMGAALPPRRVGDGIATVLERLSRNNREMAYIARQGTDDERAMIRNYFIERNRPYHGSVSDHSQEQYRELVFREHRADSTALTSMGSFAPPVFLLQDWLKWRTAAAPAATRAGQRPLPATGMTVDIPALTTGVVMSVQTTENTSTATSTPVSTYRSAPVLTISGKVAISQQSLDRFGISADQIIAEQAAREAATTLDSEVLATIASALPTSHKVTNSGTAGVPALWADVALAASKMTTAEGTRLQPDSVLMPPLNAAWFRAQVDKQTRPVWSPSAAGVAARVGQPTTDLESYTGYDIQGSCVYEDANLTPTTTHATVVVGAFGRGCLVMTGTPIIDCWPEWEPAQLTALVSIRQYVAIVVQYPSAFVRISGSAYAKTPSFTGA